MTNFKKFLSIGSMVLLVGASSLTAFAASNYTTPAEAVAGLTGKTVESITAEAQNGKTYGTIADEAGKLTEFKVEILEIKKAALAKKVEAGTITQEKANEIIAALEENQENCDGTGSSKMGQSLGANFGFGNGNAQGKGKGLGNRNAQGNRLGR